MGKQRKKNAPWKYAVSIVLILIYLCPIYVLAVMGLKDITDVSSRLALPEMPDLSNFAELFEEGSILRAMLNTVVITVVTIVLEIILGCMAAYPLARNRSRWNRILKGLILGVMMIPPLSILVGVYSTLVSMGAISTYWGIILVSTAFGLPMPIYLYSNFMSAIPVSLDEASQIDGCTPLQTFLYIILPQLKPVTVTIMILNGVNMWNEYGYSLYILQKPSMYTLTLTISQYFSSSSASDLNGAAAAACVGIVPIVVIYLVLQKYFIQGSIDSAVKG